MTYSTFDARIDRYKSAAGVCIGGFEGQAVIRNISMKGFCMISKTYVSIGKGQRYRIQILPEPESNIKALNIEAEVSSTSVTETLFTADFHILAADSGLKGYIAYLEHCV